MHRGGDLVSVVIPTYNRAYCVWRAIDSAARQTHANLEIIVVDDGSSDDTAGVVARRYAADPRVVYLRRENVGVSAARNTGLRAARGDYIALLDSDDTWKPWKIELQLRCLELFPEAGMIWTDMEAVRPDGAVISRRFLRTMYRASYRWFPTAESLFSCGKPLDCVCPGLLPGRPEGRAYCGDISSQMIMGNLVHTSTVLMRRSRLEQVGGFNEALTPSGEDFDFHLRTCQAGPVAFADIASIEYCVGALDQLNRPELGIHIARNFLRTIESVLRERRASIALPPSMLAAVQADAHEWLGRELLANGDRRGARKHLAKSLRYRSLDPYALSLFVLSCGPSFSYRLVRAAVRTAKSALRRARAPATRSSM
jgi:glycosyltransferase involved in cell wall biosynthesis